MALSVFLVSQYRIPLIEIPSITQQYFRIGNLCKLTEIFAGIAFCNSEMISCFRDTYVFFPVIKCIDLFRTDTSCFHQSMRGSLQIAFICFIYKSGPVGNYQSTTVFCKSAKLFGISMIKHIGHRCRYQTVPRQIMFHIDDICIIAFSSESTILFQYIFLIMHILVSRSLRILQRPVIFPVIENSHWRLRHASSSFPDLLQRFSYLCHFAENTGIIPTVVIDHRTMEFLRGSLTLTKLEIQNTV